MSTNPVVAEVTRGGIVESWHRGAWAVVGSGGKLMAEAGNITMPVFPRSAVKAFQCLPAIEAGVVDEFAMSNEEIALACASHNGEEAHVRVARSALAKAHLDEALYECGPQWPSLGCALRDLVRAGGEALPVHNNCSGKHAFMLAFAQKLGVDPAGYTRRDHPVQQAIEKAMGEICEFELASTPCGIDGCSVPTWALPLRNIALGFHKFAAGEGLSKARATACRRIIDAVRAHPFMVSGTGGFCTKLMQAVPRAFVKVGAEGVYCAAVPHSGIGVAMKVDDGASRGAEVAVARVLAGLGCWTSEEKSALEAMTFRTLTNRRKLEVGEVRAV